MLTLLSTVIQVLWDAKDPSPMIMPATLPLGATGVGNQLVQYLDDKWEPIIGKDVEGRESTPAAVDKDTAALRATVGDRAAGQDDLHRLGGHRALREQGYREASGSGWAPPCPAI